MNNISDPNATEMRGWVMLMLQRAAENVNPSECNDPAVLLACSLGSDSCPAACQKDSSSDEDNKDNKVEDRVIAGDLDISVVDYSSSVKSAPQGIFVANTLKFNASEKIQLDSLTLKRTGLGTSKAISKVWLEKNGVAVTNSASVSSDGLAVLNFKSNRDTISEATEYQLVVELNQGNQYQGDEFAFELKSAESTAKNTTISGTTSTYRISNYSVVELTANVQNANTSTNGTDLDPIEYKLGSSTDYIIGEFSLQSDSSSDDRDIYVKSLTFKNNGTADFGDTFKNVKVYRDSKVVSDNVEVNGKDITISLGKDTIKANRKAVYTIRAEVANLERAGDTVQLYLRDAKDIIADESDTNFRANIVFDTTWAARPGFNGGELSLYKINGGKVTFETASDFPKTVNAGISATDIVIAKGKLVVSEPVELPAIEIPYGANGWETSATSNANFVKETETIKRLVLKIGDKRYTADPDTNGKFTFKDVTVRGTSDVELLISLGSKETELNNQTITFNKMLGKVLMGTNVGSFQNNDSVLNADDVAGNIQIAKVQIKKPKFSISTTSQETQEMVINSSDSKILMKGKLEAKENDVNVNNLTVSVYSEDTTEVLANTDTIEVTLSVDGSTFGTSKTLSVGPEGNAVDSYRFNSLGTIKAGESLPFEISVNPSIAHQGNIWLVVKAEGTDTNGNSTETSEETSATLEVRGSANVEFNATNTSDRIEKPTNGITIYEGSLNVKNSNAELNAFKVIFGTTAANGITVASPKLYIDGESVDVANNNVINTATTANGVLEFKGMTENLAKGKHTVEIRANVTSPAPGANDDRVYELKVVSAHVATATTTVNNPGTPAVPAVPAVASAAVTEGTDLTSSTDTYYTRLPSTAGAGLHNDGTYAYSVANVTTVNSAPADTYYKLTTEGSNAIAAVPASTTVTPVYKDYSETSSSYFAKGKFTLSKTSTSDKVLTVKLTNTSDKNIKVTGIILNNGAGDAVVTDKDVADVTVKNTAAESLSTTPVVVGAGESVDIQVIAATDKTTRLTGVKYAVNDGGSNDYNYTLTNANTAVGSWSSFYSIKKD